MRIPFFYCLLMAIVFTACQKEISPDNLPERPANPTNPTNADSVRLKLYIELDTLLASGLDTVTKIEIGYDAQKRFSTYTTYGYDETTGNANSSMRFTFQYTGSDTVPSKLMYYGQLFGFPGQDIRDTVNLLYNSSGKLLKQYRSWVGAIIDSTVVNYYPNYVKSGYYIGGVLQPEYDSIVNKLTVVGGNVTVSLQEAHQFEPSFYQLDREGYTAMYDQAKNPFTRLIRFFEVLQVASAAHGYFGGQMISANNVIQYSGFYDDTNGSQGTNQYNCTYTYNSANYPVIGRYKYTEPGIDDIAGRRLYFYQ